jgi:hypothetical protein
MSDSNESGDDDAKPMNGPEKKSKASKRVKSIYNVVSGALEGACCARDESGGQMAEHEVFFLSVCTPTFHRHSLLTFSVKGAKGKKRKDQVEAAKGDFTAKHAEHSHMAVELQGWMWKKGDTRSNWKRRYFLLSGPFLSYYHDDEAASKASFDSYDGALGVIPLRGVKVERFFHKNRENCFKIVHKERR